MVTCEITSRDGLTWLKINGRIDSMSAPEIQLQLDDLIRKGDRLIVANLEEVGFLSSAGLRVLLIAQQQLNKVGGEIVLYRVPDHVLPVFSTSGFDQLFTILTNEEELAAIHSSGSDTSALAVTTGDGILIRFREVAGAGSGGLRIIGSQDKQSTADYTEQDVVTVSQKDIHFATGLATAGERFDEYKELFGEAVILNRHFYFYPAVKRPAVDYMFYSGKDAGTECRFLHGFAFSGPFRYLAAFETSREYVTLDGLVQWIGTLPSTAPLVGIVVLAESKGLFGMNLKQIPIRENKPPQGGDIFDAARVASWINFPVDPIDQNHIVAAAGIIGRDWAACADPVQKLFSTESAAHIHAGIFEKGPVSKNIGQFADELERVLTTLNVHKVQHLLGRSRFSNGMLGIVELKG